MDVNVTLKDERERENFELGEAWYSHDNGLTWSRQQARTD